MDYIKYNKTTCEILCVYSIPSGDITKQEFAVDEDYIEGDINDNIHYIENKTIIEKGNYDLTITNLNNIITIANIPLNTIAIFDNNSYEISDGILEIEYELKEKLIISLINIKYKDKEVILNES